MLEPNQGKNLAINIGQDVYERHPVKTHVIKSGDDLIEVVEKYLKPFLQTGDYIFISEKIVAISQGRSFPIEEIKPSWLAKFLVKFVHKSPYGIGLGSPWTMQLALGEVGAPRILLGAVVAAVTKPFGIKGMFYRVCGKQASAIDGPCDYTLPPYNHYAKLAPKDPDGVAKKIKEKFGSEVVIIDANDLGVEILGRSSENVSIDFAKAVFRDNPLGQTNEQTPLCIVRRNNTRE